MSRKRKTCRECGSREVILDGLCAECEEDFVWCCVCRQHYRDASAWCRHLFWSDAGFNGAGSYGDDWDYCKESFFALLDLFALVPKEGRDGWLFASEEKGDLVAAVERRIRRRNFWTFTVGPMLGMPDLQFREQRRDLPDKPGLAFAEVRSGHFHDWMRERGEQYHRAADGFSWLQSLGPGARDGYAQTLKWIEEWREKRAA